MKKEENKISIDQIIAFTKIPQCKSLKNVAKVLSLAPSSVSASISKLENAVGEQLIHLFLSSLASTLSSKGSPNLIPSSHPSSHPSFIVYAALHFLHNNTRGFDTHPLRSSLM